MSDTTEAQRGRKKGRSPSYPGIDLETAISRAEVLYREEGANPAHVDTILRHWGYKPGVGPGLVSFAALKKFGLLIDEGTGPNRRGRLSNLALGIIQDKRPNSAERQQAIRKAALHPPIHQELWDFYKGTLPSDENLRFTLLRDRSFTERGASEFIPVFRASVAFARLTEPANVSPEGGDSGQNGGGGMDGAADLLDPPKHRTAQSMPLPVAPGEYAVLQGSFPLTEDKWNQMLAVLTAMKPALVAPEQPQDHSENEDQG